jgi:hypothetical protein
MNHYWLELCAAAQPWLTKALLARHDPIVLVELFASTCGLLGSLVLALKGKRAAWGWVLFAFSNVGWLAFGYGYGHWLFFVQQIGFTVTSVIGIWNWLIGPAIDRHHERLVREAIGL